MPFYVSKLSNLRHCAPVYPNLVRFALRVREANLLCSFRGGETSIPISTHVKENETIVKIQNLKSHNSLNNFDRDPPSEFEWFWEWIRCVLSEEMLFEILRILSGLVHIYSLYSFSYTDTSAALGRIRLLMVSLSTGASNLLGQSIPTQKRRATVNMALWYAPNSAHLDTLL